VVALFINSLQLAARLFFYCLVACLFLFQVAWAGTCNVGVILSENSGAYIEFSDALRKSLQDTDITLCVADTNSTSPIAANLVIAVGMKAANFAAASNANAVLNVMIPLSGHRKLLLDYPKRNNSSLFSSIYFDQPIERQLNLIATAFPDRHKLGILFDATSSNELEQLRKNINEYKIELFAQEINARTSLFEALQDVLLHSDVILAIPAPEIYNTSSLRNILVSTYQEGIPLVGFSASYVKAGAMCAVFSTPQQFAAQANLLLQKFMETGSLPAAQYPKFYAVTVNERVAQSLGISIRSADEIYSKMSSTKRRLP
jgi:hypothetical protein